MSSRAPKAVSADGGSVLAAVGTLALRAARPASSVGVGSANSEMRQTSAWAASTDPASGMPDGSEKVVEPPAALQGMVDGSNQLATTRWTGGVGRSAPMSSASRVDRPWRSGRWSASAATVGVRCRLIRHHTAAAA